MVLQILTDIVNLELIVQRHLSSKLGTCWRPCPIDIHCHGSCSNKKGKRWAQLLWLYHINKNEKFLPWIKNKHPRTVIVHSLEEGICFCWAKYQLVLLSAQPNYLVYFLLLLLCWSLKCTKVNLPVQGLGKCFAAFVLLKRLEENKVMVFACLIWLVRGLEVCWVCEVDVSQLLQH